MEADGLLVPDFRDDFFASTFTRKESMTEGLSLPRSLVAEVGAGTGKGAGTGVGAGTGDRERAGDTADSRETLLVAESDWLDD